jgi:hypothetical protein
MPFRFRLPAIAVIPAFGEIEEIPIDPNSPGPLFRFSQFLYALHEVFRQRDAF